MANMRAIRTRIKSVKNTEQITKAMKMVAVSKLRRTQSSMQAMRPFSEKSQEVMDTLLSASSGLENRFIKPHKEVKKVCYVLFLGNRGLCGAYNSSILHYANSVIKQGGKDRGVAIAYDSRRMSPEFADEAALCLAANGIRAYVFDALRPTPELSFALRTLHCISGIVITASHNPPEYNGYKAYWEDGAQVTAPKDKEIIAEVKAVTDYHSVKTMDKKDAMDQGLYVVIGKEIDDAYMAELKKQIIHPDIIKEVADDIRIVYSPFHGTGNVPVRRILSELGFKHVYVVPEQELPDPDFTTLEYPNPEDPKAFTLALKLAKEKNADIVLATDPDADRLGVRVKDKDGVYHTLTGNMSGCLLEEYELSQRKAANGSLPEDGAVVSTIVTTNMAGTIARSYGLRFIEVLTGFKYIGQQILGFEQSGKGTYLFGFEESYGCLIGTHASCLLYTSPSPRD